MGPAESGDEDTRDGWGEDAEESGVETVGENTVKGLEGGRREGEDAAEDAGLGEGESKGGDEGGLEDSERG